MTEKKKAPKAQWRAYRCEECGTPMPCVLMSPPGYNPEVCAFTMRLVKWRRIG